MSNKLWKGTPFNSSYKNVMLRIIIVSFFAGMGSLGFLKFILTSFISSLYEINLLYSHDVAYGIAEVLMGVDIFAKLLVSPLTGYLADKYGRRKLVVIGTSYGIIAALSFIWAALFGTAIAIISGVIAGIIILGFETGQVNTTITISSGDVGEEYNKIGLSETIWNVALIGGMIVGVLIMFIMDLTYVQSLFFALISFIICGIVAFLLYKETLQPIGENVKPIDDKIAIKSYKDILKERNFIPLFAFSFVVEAEETGFVFCILPGLLTSMGYVSSEIPLLAGLPAYLSLGIFFIPLGYLSDKYGRRNISLIGSFSSMILFIVLYFLQSFVALLIIGFFIGISVCCYRLPIMSSISDFTTRQKRGLPYGILRAFREVGGAVTPIIFGFMTLLGVDFYNLLLIMAGMIGIAFIIALIMFKETKR